MTYPNVAPSSVPGDLASGVAAAVERYRRDGDVGLIFDALRALAAGKPAADLIAAASPYLEMPEVVIPMYEIVVDASPSNAQAMVVLANAYWLTGRGPDVVGALASRAIAADAKNRGAWHLWALADASVRGRVERWTTVVEHFPNDHLARAALADNATSLASDEQDPLALDLAITTYEWLLSQTKQTAQRLALESTLETLRKWKL